MRVAREEKREDKNGLRMESVRLIYARLRNTKATDKKDKPMKYEMIKSVIFGLELVEERWGKDWDMAFRPWKIKINGKKGRKDEEDD